MKLSNKELVLRIKYKSQSMIIQLPGIRIGDSRRMAVPVLFSGATAGCIFKGRLDNKCMSDALRMFSLGHNLQNYSRFKYD